MKTKKIFLPLVGVGVIALIILSNLNYAFNDYGMVTNNLFMDILNGFF